MTKNHDRQRLPLRALEIFDAAAQHKSFTAAGGDLGITQSAVSRKVSELEVFLGVDLFQRSGPKLALTSAGRSLAIRVSYGLDDLHRACNEVRPFNDTGMVTLSMLPSVAARWFAPKLEKFTLNHPNIDLRISTSRKLVDFDREDIDGAIRYGLGDWPSQEAIWLGSETVQPVCTQSTIERFGLRHPKDLLKAPLLHADIAEDWAAWFVAAGVTHELVPKGPNLGDDAAILQAAVSGQGVALGRSLLVADDLLASRLVAPFNVALKASYSYWFVGPSSNKESLHIVRDWIVQEFKTG